MFQTLFLNTFGSSLRQYEGFEGVTRDTALLRSHPSLCCDSMISLVSQNTLARTSVRHFSITYEAATDTFMLQTNDRNTHTLFSRPHTSINSRYTNICKFQDGVVSRVTCNNRGLLDVFENSLTMWLNNFLHIPLHVDISFKN
jgi:hypothetical protein